MKTPTLQTVSRRPDGPIWHAGIGRVVVTFGTLERVLLAWADAFAPSANLKRKHHKDGIKQIAQALKRVIRTRSSRIPKTVLDEAMAAIVDAESLADDRNDAAHGWLESIDGTVNGPIGLLVAKINGRPKLVFGFRDVNWLNGVAKRMRDATRRNHAALQAIAKCQVF